MVAVLGAVCRELREYAGLDRSRIGYHLGPEARGKSAASLRRFENGQVQPQNLDTVIQAYADELGVSPVAIWREALERYELRHPQERAQRALDARKVHRARRLQPPPESPAN